MMKKLIAPVLGLAFVVFIPVIWIGMAVWILGKHAWQFAGQAATEAERVTSPSWAVSTAYLSRNTPAKPEDAAAATPDAWEQNVKEQLKDTPRDAS